MHDLVPLLLSYARNIWRFRWYMFIEAWVVCLLGWYIVWSIPNQYQTSARIFVDTRSMLQPMLKDIAYTSQVEEQVNIMMQTILNRNNIEKVLRATDLDLTVKNDSDLALLIESVTKRIEIHRSTARNIYSISFTHEDPKTAKAVVDSVRELFVEESIGATRQDTSRAQKFLDDQIQAHEQRLEAAEDRLKEFKRSNVGLMPAAGQDYYARLQKAVSELQEEKLKYSEVVNRRDELKRQLLGEEPAFGLATAKQQSPKSLALNARIDGMQVRLDQMLLQFTERHPDVIALQNTIKELQAQLEEEKKKKPDKGTIAPDLEAGPVYQRMKLTLGEAEAEVASLQARTQEFQKRVHKLEQLVDTVPKVEADLSKLNRDYDITKRNYEALLVQRERAKISQDVEESKEKVQFHTIEDAVVPKVPIWPNRALLLTVVLLGGSGLGVAFAFFMSRIRPTFDSRRLLAKTVGFPVLGSISRVFTPKERLRRNLSFAYFGVGAVALFGVFLGLQLILKSNMTATSLESDTLQSISSPKT